MQQRLVERPAHGHFAAPALRPGRRSSTRHRSDDCARWSVKALSCTASLPRQEPWPAAERRNLLRSIALKTSHRLHRRDAPARAKAASGRAAIDRTAEQAASALRHPRCCPAAMPPLRRQSQQKILDLQRPPFAGSVGRQANKRVSSEGSGSLPSCTHRLSRLRKRKAPFQPAAVTEARLTWRRSRAGSEACQPPPGRVRHVGRRRYQGHLGASGHPSLAATAIRESGRCRDIDMPTASVSPARLRSEVEAADDDHLADPSQGRLQRVGRLIGDSKSGVGVRPRCQRADGR